MEFTGIRAIVTGGASGMGVATARSLAQRDAAVVCLDHRLEDTGVLPP